MRISRLFWRASRPVRRLPAVFCLGLLLNLTGCNRPAPPDDRAASRAACVEAESALREGRVAEAEAAWERATRLAPADPEPHAARGRWHWSRREFRRAAENFEQAVNRAPNDIDLLLALIQTRQEAGDQRRTEELARRAVSLAPDNPKALVYLGRYLAWVDGRPEARSEARDLLERAMRLAPTMPIPLIERGRLLQQEGESERAEALLTAAWDLLHRGQRPLRQLENMAVLETRRAETAYALALALRAQGRRADAEKWFARFRAVDTRIERRSHLEPRALKEPPDLEALLALARMNIETGGAMEAVPLAQRAQRVAPDDPRVRALVERLMQIRADE